MSSMLADNPRRLRRSDMGRVALCIVLILLGWPNSVVAKPVDGRRVVDPRRSPLVKCSGAEDEHVLWRAVVGSHAFSPVFADGKVIVGTNAMRIDKRVDDYSGLLMCFRSKNVSLLWQAKHKRLPQGRGYDIPPTPIGSKPCVDGNRVYYISNRGELMCVDINGFRGDDANQGPFISEKSTGKKDVDIV